MEAYKEQKTKQANKESAIIKTNHSNNIKKCSKKNIIADISEHKNKVELKVENHNRKVQSETNKQNIAKATIKTTHDLLPDLQKSNVKKLLERRPRSVTASIFAASEAKLKNTTGANNKNKSTGVISKRVVGPNPTSKQISRPQNATLKIFAPRTDDMNKGFLMFADDESGLTSK